MNQANFLAAPVNSQPLSFKAARPLSPRVGGVIVQTPYNSALGKGPTYAFRKQDAVDQRYASEFGDWDEKRNDELHRAYYSNDDEQRRDRRIEEARNAQFEPSKGLQRDMYTRDLKFKREVAQRTGAPLPVFNPRHPAFRNEDRAPAPGGFKRAAPVSTQRSLSPRVAPVSPRRAPTRPPLVSTSGVSPRSPGLVGSGPETPHETSTSKDFWNTRLPMKASSPKVATRPGPRPAPRLIPLPASPVEGPRRSLTPRSASPDYDSPPLF